MIDTKWYIKLKISSSKFLLKVMPLSVSETTAPSDCVVLIYKFVYSNILLHQVDSIIHRLKHSFYVNNSVVRVRETQI